MLRESWVRQVVSSVGNWLQQDASEKEIGINIKAFHCSQEEVMGSRRGRSGLLPQILKQ